MKKTLVCFITFLLTLLGCTGVILYDYQRPHASYTVQLSSMPLEAPTPQHNLSPAFQAAHAGPHLKNICPYVAKKGPRISIILIHMTPSLVKQNLSPEITLAFFGQDIDASLQEARHKGHECLMMIPMEPLDYPSQDPGLTPLLTGLKAEENKRRLSFHLQNKENFIMGVIPVMGSRFLNCSEDLTPVLLSLKQKNLAFISLNHLAHVRVKVLCPDLFYLKTDHQLDEAPDPEEIYKALNNLETIALQEGQAVGYAVATPFMIEALKTWQTGLAGKTLELVPLSFILQDIYYETS